MDILKIIGKIVAPHPNDAPNRRELGVYRKNEYTKLPLDTYPITHGKEKDGIGITIISGQYSCDASFHRYEKGEFFMGSPRNRLGDIAAQKYLAFLHQTGLFETGELELDFKGNQVDLKRVS